MEGQRRETRARLLATARASDTDAHRRSAGDRIAIAHGPDDAARKRFVEIDGIAVEADRDGAGTQPSAGLNETPGLVTRGFCA